MSPPCCLSSVPPLCAEDPPAPRSWSICRHPDILRAGARRAQGLEPAGRLCAQEDGSCVTMDLVAPVLSDSCSFPQLPMCPEATPVPGDPFESRSREDHRARVPSTAEHHCHPGPEPAPLGKCVKPEPGRPLGGVVVPVVCSRMFRLLPGTGPSPFVCPFVLTVSTRLHMTRAFISLEHAKFNLNCLWKHWPHPQPVLPRTPSAGSSSRSSTALLFVPSSDSSILGGTMC